MILIGVGALIALAAVPLLLPWPQHLRWLIASMAVPDPVGMTPVVPPVLMREVTVTAVCRSVQSVAVECAATSPPAAPLRYVLPADGDGAVVAAARLERWAAAATPLLLIESGADGCSLHGPAHAVVGLRRLTLGDDHVRPRAAGHVGTDPAVVSTTLRGRGGT